MPETATNSHDEELRQWAAENGYATEGTLGAWEFADPQPIEHDDRLESVGGAAEGATEPQAPRIRIRPLQGQEQMNWKKSLNAFLIMLTITIPVLATDHLIDRYQQQKRREQLSKELANQKFRRIAEQLGK